MADYILVVLEFRADSVSKTRPNVLWKKIKRFILLSSIGMERYEKDTKNEKQQKVEPLFVFKALSTSGVKSWPYESIFSLL